MRFSYICVSITNFISCNVKTFRFIIIKEGFASITLYCVRIELQFIDNVIAHCTTLSLLLSSIFILNTCVCSFRSKSKINIRAKLASTNLCRVAIELLFIEDVFVYCFKIALLLFNVLMLIIFVDSYCLKLFKAKLAFAN